MKVLPISNFGQQGSTKNISKNFKGLANETGSSFRPSGQQWYGVDTEYYNTDYYPFMDESQSSIDAYVERNTKYECADYCHDLPEQGCCERYYSVSVQPALPIKAAEWAQYVKNKFSMSKADREYIEATLKKFNLRQYIVR